MSLDNPTSGEKLIALIKKYEIWVILVGLALLVVLTWAGLHAIDVHRQNKKIADAKANVNLALQQVAVQQQVVNKDAQAEAAAVQHFKDVTNEYTNAVNATEQQRVVTNQAIANVEKAVNANVPVNTTADDIHRLLDDIDNTNK